MQGKIGREKVIIANLQHQLSAEVKRGIVLESRHILAEVEQDVFLKVALNKFTIAVTKTSPL